MYGVLIRFFIKIFLPRLSRKISETKGSQTPITFKMWFFQKVLGFNRKVYWPVHFTSIVSGHKNIYAGIDTCPGYMPGCYIQGIGKIYIGDYTQISANVGIITANHELHDSTKHVIDTVRIGKYCWIGMNVMILPGVELGDHTIVGAGSVVTKPFTEGYCVIAGNPAKVIKRLDREKVVKHKCNIEYNGYIKHLYFDDFIDKNLNL
ncbi:MAG: acyltransferase [Alteromonadales bacterium]|nr:acyltransferase [Alteromonadales bacterium]